MSWLFLMIAGILEIGWPLGMKLAETTGNRLMWLAVSVISMAGSGYFLYLAQREIPMGTAYIIWTGIGAIGTFTLGILFFKDSTDMLRIASVLLILTGIIGLKLAH